MGDQRTDATITVGADKTVTIAGDTTVTLVVESKRTADRSRTLDQIKRIYAVVMGFGATECIKNVFFSTFHVPEAERLSAALLFGSFGVAFLSLLTLFFLGAERYLDGRYLSADREASRVGVGFDLLNLNVTAVWFVVLSQSFPATSATGPITMVLSERHAAHLPFIGNLIWLNLIDLVLLGTQIARIHSSEAETAERVSMTRAHWIWIAINLATLVALGLLWHYGTVFSAIEVAAVVFTVHVVRFIVDFWLTFRFYFPV